MKTCMAVVIGMIFLFYGATNSNAGEVKGKLSGTYALTSVLTCRMIDSDQIPQTINTIYVQGTLNFAGDGTGVLDGEVLVINQNPLANPSKKYISGSFEYSLLGENYFVMEHDLYVEPDDNYVFDIVREGWIGQGGQTLIISDTNTNIETLSTGMTRQCGRTGTAVKVSDK